VIVRRLLVLAGPPVHARNISLFLPCLCTFLSSLQSPPCFPSISVVELESKRQPNKQRTTLRDSVVIVVFVVVFLLSNLLICL